MADPIVIVGAGGFGRETADVIEAINEVAPTWDLVGFVDDAPTESNLERLAARGHACLGDLAWLLTTDRPAHVVIGVGSPAARRSIAGRLEGTARRIATLVHPAATVGSQVRLGQGSVVCAGARLTTNIEVGRHVHINPNVTVGHDTVLGDFVSLNPASSVSGDCRVGAGTLVGVGAVILNQLNIGEGVVVGGAACVVKDVAAHAVVKGVPAR